MGVFGRERGEIFRGGKIGSGEEGKCTTVRNSEGRQRIYEGGGAFSSSSPSAYNVGGGTLHCSKKGKTRPKIEGGEADHKMWLRRPYSLSPARKEEEATTTMQQTMRAEKATFPSFFFLGALWKTG